MKKPTAQQVLLIIALFLAPIIGGQINTEFTQLSPGIDMLIRSAFSGVDGIVTYLNPNYAPPPSIETPTLSHAIIGVLIVLVAILAVLRNRVIQVPFLRVSVPLLTFMAWMVCTLALTSFVSLSLVALSEWFIYGIAFFAAIAVSGRRRGTSTALMAIVVGCALVAIKGLFEYGAERNIDPTWRVFSTWANPTSLAGMLTIGMMLALALAVKDEGLTSVLPWTCGLAMGCCIMATDSRGGIFSMLAGIVCLGGFICFWVGKNQATTGIAKIASVLVLALIFGRWVHPIAGSSHSGATAQVRAPYVLVGQVSSTPAAPAVVQAGQAVEQSSQFRFLLWRGAIHLMKENPLGYGMGTYRNYSAKPGLTTETQLAHNTYLQIGVEAGALGLILFAGFLVMWLLEVVRGCYMPIRPISYLRTAGVIVGGFLLLKLIGIGAHVLIFPTTGQQLVGSFGLGIVWIYVELFRKSPNLLAQQNVMRAGIIASVICMLFDNTLESGLYSFGIGVTILAILGLGLVQGADGIAPEFTPKILRATAALAAFVAGLILLHAGVDETLRSRGRYEMNFGIATMGTLDSQTALQSASDLADQALNLTPMDQTDGENWRLKAEITPDFFDRLRDLKQAASWAPNTRNFRAIGLAYIQEQDYPDAILYFNKALDLDPNNFLALSSLMSAYAGNGDFDKGISTAQRLIAVENTPYFQVRSLPQLIPVETYMARAFIASQTKDPAQKAQLLQAAVNGYTLYLQNTVPLILQMTKTDPNAQYGGETLGLAKAKMNTASNDAKELAATYRILKRPQDAANATNAAQQFLSAIPNTGT